ncbi:MAG TPA: hypothetical protein VL179_13870 [Mycobacterium sp.]|nr:hypothetical protein [Mycobacterium sp.]
MVVALDSLRMAAASGSGSLAFFDDVGDAVEGVVADADVDVDAAVDDGVLEETDGVDEQPATRAAAALTTARTAGSLRMPAIVEGASRTGQVI